MKKCKLNNEHLFIALLCGHYIKWLFLINKNRDISEYIKCPECNR